MNWIDAVVLIVWAFTAMTGAWAGFLGMVIPLLVIIVWLAVSSRVVEDVAGVFSGLTDSEYGQTIAAYVLILVAVFIVGGIVNLFVGRLLRLLPLAGLVNRIGGVVAGIAVGFLLLSWALTGVQKYTDRADDTIDESPLATFITDNFGVAISAVRLVPGDWDDEIGFFGE